MIAKHTLRRQPWGQRLAACASMLLMLAAPLAHAAPPTVTVKDTLGRTVTVPHNPSRIAAIGAGTLRQLTYLQATDKVVGAEDTERKYDQGKHTMPYRSAHPELGVLPRIGPGGSNVGFKKPEYELLLAVRPQVIFMTNMDVPLADEVQATLGIPVVILNYGQATGIDSALYDSLRVAGKVLQREKRAEEVIAYIQAAEQDLRRRVKGASPKTAYVGAVSFHGSHGINGTAKHFFPFEWLGVRNAVKDLNEKGQGNHGHIKLDKEALLRLNPEIIFVDAGGLPLVQEDYRKNPQFYQALSAVQKQQVYRLLPFNFYTVNVDTAIADAYAVGKVLYPQQFADINLPRKADEIYTFMVGKPVYGLMQSSHGALGEKIVFKP